MARRLLLLAIAVLLVAAVASPVGAENAIRKEIRETEEKIVALQSQIKAAQTDASVLSAQINQSLERMSALQVELDGAELALAGVVQALDATQAKIDATVVQMVRTQNDLATTRAGIDETRTNLQEQAAELYMRGGRPGPTTVVFELDTVQDIAVGMEYAGEVVADSERLLDHLQVLRRQEERQVELIRQQQAALEEDRILLEADRVVAEQRRAEVVDRTNQLQAELSYQKAFLQQTETEIALFEHEIQLHEAEQEKLEKLLIESQQVGGRAPGELLWPAKGVMTSGFGMRLHPILGYSRLHAGVDISSPYGTEIYAAATGKVILAGWYGGYGNAVVIDHGGGMATLYAHQSKVAVSNGATVSVGDVIGYVGSTGLSTGPHLHFEVRLSGTPVDPMQYL